MNPLPLLLLAAADLILHNGKIVTLDAQSRTVEAIAITGNRITATGASRDVLARERSARTRVIDLEGKMVLPGLIDAHVHSVGASTSEFRRPLPRIESIADIQNYIRERARTAKKGEWIVVPRQLPPRLKEMRMPTRADLDVVTDHPVAFDASYVWAANTLALKLSGITRSTPNPAGGEIVKGADGEPNGILRNCDYLLKGAAKADTFTEAERLTALEQMLARYAQAGLTAVGERIVDASSVALFEKLKAQNRLPVRVVMTWRPDSNRPVEVIEREIRASKWTTNLGDERLKFGTFKVTLDGGQSVGTAYQRMPYGPFGRQLYGQTDPNSRGTLFVEAEKLYRIYRAARDRNWQLTAHSQGGGAIDALLDAFERLDKEKPLAPTRSHVMHASFQSPAAIARMKKMGILADVQPGWLYFDVPALEKVFGMASLRYFYPLRSYLNAGIVLVGGSDHMLGFDKDRAINPYNPFLGMWMSITRRTRDGRVIYPEEKVTREEALRMWTTGPTYLQFSEKVRGALEPGKLADLVVIDRDYFRCPEDDIRAIQPVMVFVDGVEVKK
ncbi:MAG: amidohydrolase [Bryobacteraceae bacterium]|nr:amidohydrolase [Bryobacteraceae bacterium]